MQKSVNKQTTSAPKKQKFVLDTIGDENKDFFLRFLQKKNQNYSKKLSEIERLEEKSKTDQLKQEQLDKISRREEFLELKRELNTIVGFYFQAKQEKVPQANAADKKAPETTATTTAPAAVKEETKATAPAPAAVVAPATVQIEIHQKIIREVDHATTARKILNLLFIGSSVQGLLVDKELNSKTGVDAEALRQLQTFSRSVFDVSASKALTLGERINSSLGRLEQFLNNNKEDAVAGGPSFELLQTTSENLAARDAVRNLRVTVPVVVEEQIRKDPASPVKSNNAATTTASNTTASQVYKPLQQQGSAVTGTSNTGSANSANSPTQVVHHTVPTGNVAVSSTPSQTIEGGHMLEDDNDSNRFVSDDEDNVAVVSKPSGNSPQKENPVAREENAEEQQKENALTPQTSAEGSAANTGTVAEGSRRSNRPNFNNNNNNNNRGGGEYFKQNNDAQREHRPPRNRVDKENKPKEDANGEDGWIISGQKETKPAYQSNNGFQGPKDGFKKPPRREGDAPRPYQERNNQGGEYVKKSSVTHTRKPEQGEYVPKEQVERK